MPLRGPGIKVLEYIRPGGAGVEPAPPPRGEIVQGTLETKFAA